MDLTNFTSEKKVKVIEKEEIFLNNDEVRIKLVGDEVSFFFKKKSAIEKYNDFLFFSPTISIISDSEKEAEDFFEFSINKKVEGLMFKKLDSIYIPGTRVGSMVKLKETKEDLDLVILGAEFGKGKRAGFYSSFLVGVKGILEDDFLEIGKVSSGIKEKKDEKDNLGVTLDEITNLLRPLKISNSKNMDFFEPKIIIQVKYQDIQKSIFYSSGYALRFPRIISLREDKELSEINSLKDIENFIKF